MNIIAIDIGNTNIRIGLFLDGEEQFIRSIGGDSPETIAQCLVEAWEQVPVAVASRQAQRDGVIVISSVKPVWTQMVETLAEQRLGEKCLVIGRDIPLPMSCWVDTPEKVGADRLVLASAAYDVVEAAVIVIDIGTAMTIDLVDQNGVFRGGVICPGLQAGADALHQATALLPTVQVHRPDTPYGRNTEDAINCGLYYSMIGTLQEVVRRYAEELGTWPQTVITGSGAAIVQQDCDFIDSYVPNLVVKGIVLAYQKYLDQQAEAV